jgi:hypothetical protein
VAADLKVVRVSADLRAAREVNEFQVRLSLAQRWKSLSARQLSEQSVSRTV